MTTARSRIAAAALVVVGAVAGICAIAGSSSGATPSATLGPEDATVTLTIRHSRFTPDHLTVKAGTLVHFVIRNEDPIGHEFIVGDEGVHARHEAGTEASHPPRPGEVSVAPTSTAETTFRFEGTTGAGAVVYACHLPGHFRYGMSGAVDVVPS